MTPLEFARRTASWRAARRRWRVEAACATIAYVAFLALLAWRWA